MIGYNIMEWNIGYLAKKRAAFSPSKTAIIYEDKPITYKQLNDEINRAAHFLQEKGLKKGDRIAVDLLNCLEFIYLYFAGAKLGLIFVPLNFRLVGPELQYQLNNCGARLLAFHDRFSPVIDQIRPMVQIESDKYVFVQSLNREDLTCPPWAVSYLDAIGGKSTAEPEPQQAIDIDDPLAIIYTSGVTGDPKGAVVSHNQTYFKNFQIMLYNGLHPEDVSLAPMPLFHSAGIFIYLTPGLNAGLTLIMRQNFDPSQFALDIETYRATHVSALTTMWKFILDSGKLDQIDTSSIRCVVGGGERTPPSLLEALASRGIHLQQGFGQTENSAMMTLPKTDIMHKQGSIGLPGYFTEIWIAGKDGRKLPPGEIGEITAMGPTIMSGYWDMPEITAQTLADGVLKTGDLGYVDEDGYFYIVDRTESMYRSGGENVYPAEVEKVLSNHPLINEIVIVGVDDDKWGETGKAYVVPKMAETISLEQIHEFLDGKVARFKYPAQLELLESMPMTASGKIKRAVLV